MNFFFYLKRLSIVVFAALLALAPVATAQTANHVLISQVYGGGVNSGATYRYDFIELYNPTSAAVDLSTWSIQYASTTGPSGGGAYAVANLSGVIGAGQYFLIQACIGNTGSTNGALPPAADYTFPNTTNASTCSPALAAGAGKVALVSNQTALAGPFGTTSGLTGATCPTVNTAAIVDYVGYGPASTCYAGTGTTPTLSATLAAIRDSANDNSGSNNTDFSALTPNPRNSATNGGSATALSVTSANANPASVTSGASTTLSVTVKPGTDTISVMVKADLSSVGGSSTQALTLSSTANVYTYSYAVPSGTTAKVYSLPVTVTDQTSATASAAIALTVVAPVVNTPIATIQANRSTYVGTNITFSGVITMVTSSGYYLQTPSSTPGSTGDEGILVYSGTGKNPATAVVGNNVTVTGLLTLFPLPAASHTPSLEVTGASLTVNSTGNTPPAAVPITSLTAAGGIYQLTPYESMRVSIASLTSTGPTDGNLTEATETTTSTGQFYAVLTGTARPFREPGMDFRDYPTATCPTVTNCTATATAAGALRPSAVTLFDDNPERIIVESSLGGGTALDVTTGTTLTGATGVLDFSYATDVPYGDPARIILDPGVFTPGSSKITGGLTVTPLTVPGAGVFTVAAFNIERFFNTNGADNKYNDAGAAAIAGTAQSISTSLAVNVTADAYARRLKKVSLAIRTVLNNPDIISLEETENVSVLQDIAAQIDADTTTGIPPHYVAYGTDSLTTYTDDVGGISIGFLVKSDVAVTAFEQMGAASTFTASTGVQTLNDRPSDVLHATVSRGAGVTPYPITVISNHLRSLSGIGTSADTRLKKELQAEMLATLIQTYQSRGEHVIAVGDMNAFQFSDGYTDTLGTITGNVGTNIAVQPGKGGILTTPAVDLITLLPANQQQTYVEFGNAQVLDHAVVSADLASSTLQVAHFDSDFPNILANDATTAARVSDHDVPVTYITLPAPVVSGTLSGMMAFPNTTVGSTSAGQGFTLTNTGEAAIVITSIVATGDFAQSNTCGSSLAIGSSCAINVVFTPTATGARTGSLTVISNATVADASLTGTGTGSTATTTIASISSTSFSILQQPAGIGGHVSCNAACGMVGLSEDGVGWIGIALDSNGNFSANTNNMPIQSTGLHTVTVTYLGNGTYAASAASTLTFSIVPAGSTPSTTAASISSTSFSLLQPAGIGGHVSCNAACGRVGLNEDGVGWIAVTLDSNGNFSANTNNMPMQSIGQHTVTATYLGNGTYAASAANTLTFSIVPSGSTPSTTTANISSSSFSISQQPAGIGGHVSCNAACGRVGLSEDGIGWIGIALDSNGNFSANTNNMPIQSTGQHTVTVTYLGNATYAFSQSPDLTFTITP